MSEPETHSAFPGDIDGAGVHHPGPASACREPECLIELITEDQHRGLS